MAKNLDALERDFLRLNIDYCACIDEDRLEDWPLLFIEDGHYFVQSRENVEAQMEGGYWMYYTSRGMMDDRVTSLRHISTFNRHYYSHLVSNLRIVSDTDDIYCVRSNFLFTQSTHEGKTPVIISGEYHDEIIYVDGAARFKKKLVLPNTFHTPTAIISPL
jgi:anthranilate 1,2-dioxygenase small subunit